MAELKIPVRTTTDLVFNPTLLTIIPVETDLASGVVKVSYDLKEEAETDTNKYEVRNWVDSGVVNLPLSVLAQAVTNEGLNIPLINQILASFNLEVDTSKL